MRIRVGPDEYALRLVEGTLVLNGETCASLCDHDRREILISDRVPLDLRMAVTAIAVSEAWAHQVATLRHPLRIVGRVS